jgi:hypothetical protein
VPFRGRVPKFCSRSCRQRAYEERKWRRPTEIELLARDIASVRVRDRIRTEVWSILKQAGLVVDPTPPPAPKQMRRGPNLRLVE